MIAAACVLHNFIIIHDGINVEEEDDFFNEANIEIDDIVHEEGLQAVQKRTQIIELF